MPHIDIRLSKPCDAQTRDALQKEIAGNMELIPGKTAANTLICISDGYSMYRDYTPLSAAFVDIRLYKESPAESKAAFAKKMFEILERVLGIPPTQVQMNFIEMPCWASGGNYF